MMKNKCLLVVTALCTVAMGATLKRQVTINSFNAGQLSPLMNSRVDLPHYKTGAKTLQNMLVRTQGPITRRPGTKYIATVKDSTDATRVIPFEVSTIQSYIVELGESYARFFKDGAYIAGSEIATPWSDANDIFEIQYAQDAKTMRLVHPDYEPYKITMADDTNDASWTCTAVGSETGPFLAENTDKTWTLTPDDTTGDIAIVSTDALFDDDHVGALFRISHMIESAFKSETWQKEYDGDRATDAILVRRYQYVDASTKGDWAGDVSIERKVGDGSYVAVFSDHIEFDGNIHWSGQEIERAAYYRIRIQDLDLDDPPHELNGSATVTISRREFLNNGIVEITAVTDSENAEATVKHTLGDDSATYWWAEGAWSDYRGWPRTVEYHEQRVIYGGSKSYPQTIWSSIIADEDDDYDDFTANTESDWSGNLGGPDDIAWTYTLPGMSSIQWMESGELLFIGTSSGIGKLGQPGKPITPNFPPIYRTQNYNGCDYIQPVCANDAILYVERGGQKVRELSYTYTSEKYIAPDMTILSEDITSGGIVDIAFQARPDPVLWCVRDDGTLLSFTYERRNKVAAWAKHTTGSDSFESVACIPGSASENELWSVVNRTVDSSTVRYIEQFQPFDWEKVSSPADQNDCWFVDCGTTAFNTLTHLKGETVAGWCDGRPIGTYTVSSSGDISPSGSYTNKTVGLPYTSVYETMPIVLAGDSGPLLAEYTNIMDMRVKFYKSLGCHVGPESDKLVDLEFSADSFATTLDAVTDYKAFPYVWGDDRAPTVYFAEADPSPLTIESIHLKVEVTHDE